MMHSILCTFFALFAAVSALPTGAPGCAIDMAAPMQLHLQARGNLQPRTGPLADGTYVVTVGGTVLDPAVPLEVAANTVIDVVVTSETGEQAFKGVLGIIHADAYNFTFRNLYAGSADVQNSTACAFIKGLSGFTHVSAADKTSVTGKLFIPVNIDSIKLDVNVVVANNDVQGSIYYYTQFQLKSTGATDAPIPAPTSTSCGLLGLSLFCPFTLCGLFGRLLGLC